MKCEKQSLHVVLVARLFMIECEEIFQPMTEMQYV